MGSDMSGYGWGWMIFGGFHMLLFWALIILAIVALVKWLSNSSSVDALPRPEKTPLQVLQERYARGELEREDYLRMKSDLEQ